MAHCRLCFVVVLAVLLVAGAPGYLAPLLAQVTAPPLGETPRPGSPPAKAAVPPAGKYLVFEVLDEANPEIDAPPDYPTYRVEADRPTGHVPPLPRAALGFFCIHNTLGDAGIGDRPIAVLESLPMEINGVGRVSEVSADGSLALERGGKIERIAPGTTLVLAEVARSQGQGKCRVALRNHGFFSRKLLPPPQHHYWEVAANKRRILESLNQAAGALGRDPITRDNFHERWSLLSKWLDVAEEQSARPTFARSDLSAVWSTFQGGREDEAMRMLHRFYQDAARAGLR